MNDMHDTSTAAGASASGTVGPSANPTSAGPSTSAWLAGAAPDSAAHVARRFVLLPHVIDGDVAGFGIAIADVAGVADAATATGPLAMPPNARAKRRGSFVAGRLCAERAVQAITGRAAPAIARGAGGEPLWPAGLVGSITHTDRWAYAAVGRRRGPWGLGIDTEPVVDDAALASVLALCTTPLERRHWLAGARPHVAATLLFSAKEAFYKAVFPAVARWIDFDEVEVTDLDIAAGSLSLRCRLLAVDGARIEAATCRFRVDAGTVHTSCMP